MSMLALNIGGYTTAQVLAALRGTLGKRQIDFRFELLDKNGTIKKTLTNVTGGGIKHDAEAEIKRSGQLTIREDGSIIYLSDRIKVWFRLRMPDGVWIEWPKGVFLLTTPVQGIDSSSVITRAIDVYDSTIVLKDDKVASRYYVAAGAKYTDAIVELLTGTAGIWSWNVTTSLAVLPVAKEWDPGTEKYVIISDLMKAINYNSIWFDGSGVAQVTPYVDPNDRTADFDYSTDGNSVTLPDAKQTLDLFGQPNSWVFYVSNPDRAALRVTRTNTSALSPTSTVSRGRTITAMVPIDDAVDAFVLGQIADQKLVEASMVYEEISFNSALMPHHTNLDIYTFAYTGLLTSGKYAEYSWEMPLAPGAVMTHVARKAVDLV